MHVTADELCSRLQNSGLQSLPKIILINGNEPLLVEEALDQARLALKQLGFSERIKYQLEAGFDWNKLTGVGQSLLRYRKRSQVSRDRSRRG